MYEEQTAPKQFSDFSLSEFRFSFFVKKSQCIPNTHRANSYVTIDFFLFSCLKDGLLAGRKYVVLFCQNSESFFKILWIFFCNNSESFYQGFTDPIANWYFTNFFSLYLIDFQVNILAITQTIQWLAHTS